MIKANQKNEGKMTTTHSTKTTISTEAITLAILLSPPAFAGDKANVTGYAAVGALMLPEYEGSDDSQVVPLIAGRENYDQYYIETNGLGLRANVSPYKGIEFGPVIKYTLGRDDGVKNAKVKRMREIDAALGAGAFVRVPFHGVMDKTDELAFELQAVTDVSDTSDGTTISFGPSYSYSATEKLRLGVSASATYATDNYNETYFGIDADNAARSGLAAYKAEGGFKDVGLMVNANYALNQSWGLTGLVGYKQLIGDAADSPIVDKEGSAGQMMVGAGVSYSF
jgi:outer membrane protein